MSLRDPLVLAYKALTQAIQNTLGTDIHVFDGTPNPTEFKKALLGDNSGTEQQIKAAHLFKVGGSSEKGLMREYIPHGIIDNLDGTFTEGTESIRMDYLIQVSFYANRPGIAEQLNNDFMGYIESNNEISLPGDKWNEQMYIFLEGTPTPPTGEPDVYVVHSTYRCRGKLITEKIVNSIDVSMFHPKVT
jgi:hypothetical protein